MNSPLFDAVNYVRNLHAFPPAAVGLFMLALGLAVLLRERGSVVSFAFLALTAACSVWLISYYGILSAKTEALSTLWVRVASVAVSVIPAAVYIFTLAVVEKLRRYRGLVFFTVFISLAFAAAVVKTNWFVEGVYKFSWGYYGNYGHLSLGYLTYLCVVMLVSLRIYWAAHQEAYSETKKIRLRFFLAAFAIGYLGAIDFLPAYGIPCYPIGYVPVSLFLIIVGVAIWRYRLVDITPSFAAEHILRTISDALLVIDRDGMIRLVNKTACTLFSHTEDTLVGKPASVLGSDFFRRDKLAWLLWSGKQQSYEIVYKTDSGEELLLDMAYTVMRDDAGNAVAALCVLKDVTAKRQAEKDLIDSERRYRLLAENITDVIWTTDLNLCFTYVSASISKLCGYKNQQLLGRPFEDILMPPSARIVTETLAEELIVEKQKRGDRFASRTLELEYKKLDGNTVCTEVKITFLRGVDEKPTGILGVTRDITTHKQAEAALRENSRNYFNLVYTSQEPILTLDRHGYIQSVNRAGEEALGYPSEELTGKHFTKFGIVAPDSVARIIHEFTYVVLGWQRPNYKINVISKDQHLHTVEASSSLIKLEGDETRVQIVFHNVQDRRPMAAQRYTA
ncbi:MAG: PAS domain S-box protein [Candidatus Omnitrophota bacterium]|nr:PAS domain S-box protein [Candidatus Omnitrophota bacterium]